MHPFLRLVGATAGLAIVVATPSTARSAAELCTPWTEWVPAFTCSGQQVLRQAYCESIAPEEVLELCTVCANTCQAAGGQGSEPMNWEYMCYGTHEEECSDGTVEGQ